MPKPRSNSTPSGSPALTTFQTKLLNEFWDQFLATDEWPRVRVVHSKYDKKRTRDALAELGAEIVQELEDHSKGNYYNLSISGVLQTKHGAKCRQLLVNYLHYLRDLYHREPEKLQVSDADVTAALKLEKADCRLLGKLLSLRPLFDRSGNEDTWTARVPLEVEDFPRTGSLESSLDALLRRHARRGESVFLSDRRMPSMDLPLMPGFGEPAQPAPVSGADVLKKRYQVFVSSTYEDLQAARQHVIQALLETKCIPTAMELFPAASVEQWELIRRVIDECDYYFVVVAGRYGSVNAEGVSYTELEFDYAVATDKPVVGFVHRNPKQLPGTMQDDTDEARAKLAAFTKKVKNRICRHWSTPEDLASAVKSAVLHELEFTPRPGWIRADAVPTSEAAEKMKQRIADLEERLKDKKHSAPDRTPATPASDEPVTIPVEATYEVEIPGAKTSRLGRTINKTEHFTIARTWDEMLLLFSDSLKKGTTEEVLRRLVSGHAAKELKEAFEKRFGKERDPEFSVEVAFFDRVVHTFAARKLIRIDLPRSRYGHNEAALWLTPAGITRVAELKTL